MRHVLLLAILILCVANGAQAQNIDGLFGDKLEGLRGLRYMDVVVEDIPELQGRLSSAELKTVVELKLRQNGIAIDSNPLAPFLHVSLNVLKIRDDTSLVYNLRLEFKRSVTVFNPELKTRKNIDAAVWGRETVGIRPMSQAREFRNNITELMDEFLNDYLAANPKR